MADESDSHVYSPSEIAAMRYAYWQLLGEYPDRFPKLIDKEELARSVVKSLEQMRAGPATDTAEVVAMIMAEDDG